MLRHPLLIASIRHFDATGIVPDALYAEWNSRPEFGGEMLELFRSYRNREFVQAWLRQLCAYRRDGSEAHRDGDLILQLCYILGMHGCMEDSLLIWQAKCTDFDSYNYIDIQLIPFMGFEATLAYLQTVATPEAKAAIEYLNSCAAAGDFDELEQYYQSRPWFF